MLNTSIEAYDDGYFPPHYKGGRGSTYVVGVEVRNLTDTSKIAWSLVTVDQNTTMNAIVNISRFLNGELILLDGVTYAGFDVVDPVYIYRATGKGVIVIQTHSLNLDKIKKALQKHFTDWNERYRVIEYTYRKMVYVETPWRTIRVYAEGIDLGYAIDIVRGSCIYSPIPEPLRIADKIASALSRTHFIV